MAQALTDPDDAKFIYHLDEPEYVDPHTFFSTGPDKKTKTVSLSDIKKAKKKE